MAGLFSPTVEVNDEVIEIKPNSLSYKEGFGETKLRVVSSGGNQTRQIATEDISTKMGMVKFTVIVDLDTPDKIRSWQALSDGNVVRFSDSGVTRTFQMATIVNDPEVALGVDAEVEVEFSSRPAV